MRSSVDNIGRRDAAEIPATLILHGKLRRQFGAQFRIAGNTPGQALAVLMTLRPDFRAALDDEAQYRVVRGPLKKGRALDEMSLHIRLPPNKVFHLVPLARGSGRGGGKAIMGIVLIAAAFILPIAAPAYFGIGGSILGAGTLFGATALTGFAGIGVSLLLGGISQMLSPQPKSPTAPNAGFGNQQTDPSYLIGGSLNVSTQGGVVPVQYGRTVVGSIQASIGYEAIDISQGKTATTTALSTPEQNFLTVFGTPPTPATTTTTNKTSLRSKAVVRILDVLGEGPVSGFANGIQDILLNGTPLASVDGKMNFQGVTVEWRSGTGPGQLPITGFPASETTIGVNAKVVVGGSVVRTITDAAATAVRVTIQIPRLYEQDQKTGELRQTGLNIDVLIKPTRSGTGGWVGGWQQIVGDPIVGMTTAPYQKSYRLALPGITEGANTWDVMVQRSTPDSSSQFLFNDLYFDNYVIITDHKLTYGNSACVAITFDAELFGSSIPERKYILDGRLIQIPENYDPINRTYASTGPGTTGGTWDAVSFKQAFCANPAWVLHDMLTHPRYGAGIGGRYVNVTRAQLYITSQYCDGLVPDGFGAMEPRYRVNANISGQAEAYTLIQTMVSAFRGMSYWGGGQVAIVTDMPKLPVKLINQTNVVDGKFNLEGTSLRTRHNIVRVQYRDPANQYETTMEMVEDTDDIARRGAKPTDIVAFGCTSRGAANRVGRWLLYTEANQTETLTYEAGISHLNFRPGEVFQQQDPAYVGLRWSGRCRDGSTDSVIALDSFVDPDTGTAFTFSVVLPDGSIETRVIGREAILGAGDHSVIHTFVDPLSQVPSQDAVWIIYDNTLSARLWEALVIHETERGRFQVVAVNYEPGKFDWIEFGVALKKGVYSKLPELLTAALAPPTNVSARDYWTGSGITTIMRVTVSWTAPVEPRMTGFQVQAVGQTSTPFAQIWDTRGSALDIDGLIPGQYIFSVRTTGKDGRASVWVSTQVVTVDGTADPPDAPLAMTAYGGTRRVFTSWFAVTRRDIRHYELQRAPDLGGGPAAFTTLAFVGGTAFVDSSPQLIPKTRWWYRVRAIATTGQLGGWSGEANAETTWLIADDLEDGILNTAKFARTIMVPTITDQIPTVAPGPGESSMRFNTANGQLYTWNGLEWKSVAQTVADAGVSVTAGAIIGQLTSEQISSLNASKLTGQIVESQIFPGSISTPLLAAGAVRTQNIAAGAVTAETLAVSSSANLIWNSCLEISAEGWSFAAYAGGPGGTVFESIYDPTWRLRGSGTGYIYANATFPADGNDYLVAAWDPTLAEDGIPGVPFPSGVPCEAQVRVGQHRCIGTAIIAFYDQSGNQIGASPRGRSVGGSMGGNLLDGYHMAWTKAVSPPGTARARLLITGSDDGGGDIARDGTPQVLFFTQAAIGVGSINATSPQPWAPGGLTSLTGTMIRTGTVAADKIVARSITGDKVVANQVIAGTIAAAAIGAQEIAASEIYGYHLAAEFALFQSAQIGTATIHRANIQDLEIVGTKVAYNAISNVSTAVLSVPFNQGPFGNPGYTMQTILGAGIDVGPQSKVIITARVRTNGVTLSLPNPPSGGGES